MAFLVLIFLPVAAVAWCRGKDAHVEAAIMGEAYGLRNATRWLPERTPPRGDDDWWGVVVEELRRSVEAMTKDGRALEKTLRLRDHFVLVYENRVVVHRKFFNHTKQSQHAKMIRSVVAELLPKKQRLANVAYSFSGATTGYGQGNPLLVINKQFGYDQCGVLIPNTYFSAGNLSTWRAFERSVAPLPWTDRPPQNDAAFWRGTVIFKPKCVDNWGNFARLQALSLAVQAPDLVDVGCVAMHGHDLRRSCVFGVDPHSCDGEPRPPATWRRPKEDSLTKAVRKFVPVHDFAKRRVLLNLPGAKSGSYSRNLNVLWMMKSVVLLWNGPFVEWYYPALAHGVTHLAVDVASLPETVARIRRDHREKEPAALVANARKVHDTFLCADCIANYFKHVVDELRTRFDFGAVLDHPDKARAIFRRVGFDADCADLVEIIDDPDTVLTPGSREILTRSLRPDDPVCGGSRDEHGHRPSSQQQQQQQQQEANYDLLRPIRA